MLATEKSAPENIKSFWNLVRKGLAYLQGRTGGAV
jgi:hypothetical protein